MSNNHLALTKSGSPEAVDFDLRDYFYHAYGQNLWFYITVGALAFAVALINSHHPIFVVSIALLCALLPIPLFKLLKWRFSERTYPLGSVLVLFTFIHFVTFSLVIFKSLSDGLNTPSDKVANNKWFVARVEDHSRKAIVGAFSNYSYQEIQNLPKDKKMIYSIVIPTMVTNEKAKAILDDAIAKITSDDPDIDELTVEAYSNKDEVIGQHQDIGEAIWGYEGKLGGMTPEIVTRNDRTNYATTYKFEHADLISYLKSKNHQEVVDGLPQTKRMAIFKAMMSRTGDLATLNAQWARKHPSAGLTAINARYDALNDKIMQKIKQEFHVSEAQLDKISTEGSEKHWAMGLKDTKE